MLYHFRSKEYTIAMKKVMFGIFAHPDDEAFGPSGTLLHIVQRKTDVHLICATDGAAGINCDDCEDLGACRTQEWLAAGKAFGATSMKQLGFADGSLCNGQFHTIAAAVESRIYKVCDRYEEPVEMSFMTFERGGITGHIDHIVMSMVTSYIFHRLKNEPVTSVSIGKLWYFCLPQSVQSQPNTSFVYMPKGLKDADITYVEDVRDVLDKKLAIMRLHHSQRSDAETILRHHGDKIGLEHFVIES